MGRLGILVLSAASAALMAAEARAQVVVNPTSGRVSIRASGQPIFALLDQLARQTGMRIEYEKSPPRQTVSLTVEDRTPAQAIVALLDGLNIPYALSLTADGSKVQTLVIADTSAPPKGAKPRVGREISMTPPDEPSEALTLEQPDPNQPETPAETSKPEPATRLGVPPPPLGTLPSAFPTSPFGAGESKSDSGASKPEAPPADAPPQVPQAEKEPNV